MTEPETITRTLTREEYTAEIQVAFFRGAVHFWQHLEEYSPEDARQIQDHARLLLRTWASLLIRAARPEGPRSPIEKAAFAYCGVRWVDEEAN